MAEHDVVCARSAVDGLVKVVAHGVGVRQALEIGRIALLDVVEAQSSGAFARGGWDRVVQCVLVRGPLRFRRRVRRGIPGGVGEELAEGGAVVALRVLGLGQAVGSGADGRFHPGEQLTVAAGGILPGGVEDAAVQLLPHLVEAVHGTGAVVRVGKAVARGGRIGAIGRWNGPAGRLQKLTMRRSGV